MNTCLLDSDLSLSYAVSRNQVLRVNSIFFSFSYSYILRKYTIIVTVEKKKKQNKQRKQTRAVNKVVYLLFLLEQLFRNSVRIPALQIISAL